MSELPREQGARRQGNSRIVTADAHNLAAVGADGSHFGGNWGYAIDEEEDLRKDMSWEGRRFGCSPKDAENSHGADRLYLYPLSRETLNEEKRLEDTHLHI